MRQHNSFISGHIRNQHGGIGMRIVMAIVTLAVLAAGVVVLVGNFQKEQQARLRKAGQCSEEGLLVALETLSADRTWRGPLNRTECGEDGWYMVTVKTGESAGVPTLTVTAEGHNGSVVRRQLCDLHLSISTADSARGPDSVWIQQSLKQE